MTVAAVGAAATSMLGPVGQVLFINVLTRVGMMEEEKKEVVVVVVVRRLWQTWRCAQSCATRTA